MPDPAPMPGLLDSDRIATLEAKLAVALEAIEDLRLRVTSLSDASAMLTRSVERLRMRAEPIGRKRR